MAGEIQLNSVSLATESGGTVTLNSSTDIKGCINASGSAPIYACRAWINFDGISGSIGTGRANGNVSGVTDNGTGDYTITFATAMPDANYSVSGTASQAGTGNNGQIFSVLASTTPTNSSFQFRTQQDSVGVTDSEFVYIAIFR